MKRKNSDRNAIKKRRERVKQLYEEGCSLEEIGVELNCNYFMVRNDLKVLKIRKTKKDIIKERQARIKELLKKGYSPKEIATELNCHFMTIYNDLNALTLHSTSKVTKKLTMNERREKIKELYKEGYCDREMAAELGCHYITILSDLKALDLTPIKKPKKIEPTSKTKKEKIKERQEKVKELCAKGYSCEEIANQLDCSCATISNDYKALGIVKIKKTWKEAIDERRALVKELHESGYSSKEIAAKLHYCDMTIYMDLKALNEESRS